MTNLSMAVELRFDDPSINSHKVWRAVLASNHIAIAYGRERSVSNEANHTLETIDKANAKFWSLLRDKAGKGYRVVDAIIYEDVADIDSQIANASNGGRYRIGRLLIQQWVELQAVRRREGQAADQDQPNWRTSSRSPRTASAGKTVIAALRYPNCPEDILLDCAMATESERFLWPMALSHPNCPDEARVGRALVEMSLV